jgi:hypothetical protein
MRPAFPPTGDMIVHQPARLPLTAMVAVIALSALSILAPATAQQGVTRSQTEAVSGAVQNQLRHTARPWQMPPQRQQQGPTAYRPSPGWAPSGSSSPPYYYGPGYSYYPNR